MATTWLPQATKVDLSGKRGNGPFPNGPRGVVLHVNDSGKGSNGTSPQWYKAGGGPDEVCPNFQVMTDGTLYQFLPLDWEPWTQRDGNSWGLSIETGGDPSEPLNPKMIEACAIVVAAAHTELGVPLKLAKSPSDRGLGTHAMGGGDWGGHSCPGRIRTAQRSDILARAAQLVAGPSTPSTPAQTPLEEIMADRNSAQYKQFVDDVAEAVLTRKTGPRGATLWGEVTTIAQRVEQVADLVDARTTPKSK